MLVKKVFFRELVSNASKIFIVLVFILPITELFKLLDQAASGNIPTITLITLMIYGTIASFPMILTIACFLTVVITINRYCKDHEYSIWLSSGISNFYWLKQVAIFSLPMALICGFSSMYITPWATVKSQNYTDFLTKQQANLIISPGVFREDSTGNQVFYLEHYSIDPGIAKKIFVQFHEGDKNENTVNITADSGMITNHDGVFQITLKNGNRDDLFNSESSNILLHFDEFKATIKQQYNPLAHGKNLNIPTATISQLLDNSSTRAKSELSWRISIAAMMFVMCLIAVPLSIQVGRVQSNLVFIVPPILYAVYENIVLTLNGYINDGKITIYAVFLLHFILILLAIGLTYIKTLPKGYLFSKNKR